LVINARFHNYSVKFFATECQNKFTLIDFYNVIASKIAREFIKPILKSMRWGIVIISIWLGPGFDWLTDLIESREISIRVSSPTDLMTIKWKSPSESQFWNKLALNYSKLYFHTLYYSIQYRLYCIFIFEVSLHFFPKKNGSSRFYFYFIYFSRSIFILFLLKINILF